MWVFCLCILKLRASAKEELTVHIEVNTSGQVGFQVFKIGGCAHVHAIVCALDGLQHQDAPLAFDQLPLEVKKDRRV